jgi:hypothetical protein
LARRSTGRTATLLEYFANPAPKMGELEALGEEGLALSGDEDIDARVSALE